MDKMDAKERELAVLDSLRELCNRMAATHGLSREQAQELYTHMEDKALAYMSGDENLSSEDVVLLVREHFGSTNHLQEMFGEDLGRGGLAARLAKFWPKQRSTDFWGIFHFPWLRENRLLFATIVFVGIETIGYLLVFLIGYGARHGHSRGGGTGPAWWAYVLVPVIATWVTLLFFAIYTRINTKLQAKRASLRRNVDLETEGIVLRGMLQAPAIIQSYENKLVLVPLVGEPMTIPLSQIQSVKERRFFNGTRYFGDNSAFGLDVEGHSERIGFIVPRPQGWRVLLSAKRQAA